MGDVVEWSKETPGVGMWQYHFEDTVVQFAGSEARRMVVLGGWRIICCALNVAELGKGLMTVILLDSIDLSLAIKS